MAAPRSSSTATTSRSARSSLPTPRETAPPPPSIIYGGGGVFAGRKPFYSACPLCGCVRSFEVVTFAELSFHRCAACGLLYKREQNDGVSGEGLTGHGYDEVYFRTNRAGY